VVVWAGYVARANGTRNTDRILVGKHKGKGPFGCPLNTYWDNIEMDVREMECEHADWLMWLKGGASGVFLRTRQWNFGRLLTA
jgi:hypothetical protein